MALKGSCPTLAKIAADEPLFVLRARDTLAPGVVREWALRAEKFGVHAAKSVEAWACAEAMEAWQKTNGCRVPD